MFRKFRFSPEAYPPTLYFIYAQKSNSTPLKKKKKETYQLERDIIAKK